VGLRENEGSRLSLLPRGGAGVVFLFFCCVSVCSPYVKTAIDACHSWVEAHKHRSTTIKPGCSGSGSVDSAAAASDLDPWRAAAWLSFCDPKARERMHGSSGQWERQLRVTLPSPNLSPTEFARRLRTEPARRRIVIPVLICRRLLKVHALAGEGCTTRLV
jgi:hypothetical protein